MKPKPASLEQIERWMQSVITHPGGVADGIASPQARAQLDVAPEDLESVIRPSQSLSSSARLEIYVDAYHERLLECLREEFTATRAAVGDELFDGLAFGYLQRYPSRSYTLNVLGGRFPQFLAESRLHAHGAPEGSPATWTDFVIELATFERLLRDVFDARGSEGMPLWDAERLADLDARAWADVRLLPVPCLRLARFEHGVNDYWTALKQGSQPSIIAPGGEFLAINRRDYVVQRHPLSAVQFALLGALVEGSTLGAAIATAAAGFEANEQALERRLGAWFSEWSRDGFFLGLTIAGAPGGLDATPLGF